MSCVRQMDLVTGILGVLEKQGVTTANARQMNAVIAAANDIVDAFAKEHAASVPGSGLGAWLASDDTGLSSRYMARVLAPLAGLGRVPEERAHFGGVHWPHDGDDFGRCVRLLQAVPELRPHVPAMAGHGKEWSGLVQHWEELEASHAAGTDIYDLMREVMR